MSIQIVKKGKRVEKVEYRLHFNYADSETFWGYVFDCNDKGEVVNPEHENYKRCLTGKINDRELSAPTIECYRHSYWNPSIGRCYCGRKVCLGGFTNTCDCGREYNSSGQELAPREQWGEETGEYF